MIDFKEDYQEYYQAKKKPSIVNLPRVSYIAIRGKGNPYPLDSEFRACLKKLEQVTLTIRNAKKNGMKVVGFEEYTTPPKESLWWREPWADPHDPNNLYWTAMLRVPDFVTKELVEWAKEETAKDRKEDYSMVTLLSLDEGMSVQCLHTGTHQEVFKTIHNLQNYLAEIGFCIDFEKGVHHEIHLGDEVKAKPENAKSIIRYPIRSTKMEEEE